MREVPTLTSVRDQPVVRAVCRLCNEGITAKQPASPTWRKLASKLGLITLEKSNSQWGNTAVTGTLTLTTHKTNLYTALYLSGLMQMASPSTRQARLLSLTPASNPVFVSKGQTSLEISSTALPKRWPQQCGTRWPGGAELSPSQSSLSAGSHVQWSNHTIFTRWEM